MTPKGQKIIVSTHSDEAGDSDHTLGYIVSGDEDSEEYDSSDDKPLSKYVVSERSAEKKRGRPRGQAKPKN